MFHSVTLLCTCFLELELLICFLSLWCSLNLSCLHAPPVTLCDLFSIDNKICVKKKTSPSHHQLTCRFHLYWSYVSFTTSCFILGTQNLVLNFIYYSSSLLFYFFLDIIFYSFNYYTVSDINIELFYYTSPKSMLDCKGLKVHYKSKYWKSIIKKGFCLRCEAHWTIPG